MALSRDLSGYLDDELEYPGVKSRKHPEGKTYKVAPPDARTGLWLSGLSDVATAVLEGAPVSDEERAQLKLDDDSEKTFYEQVLGPTFAELVDDGVSWPTLKRIGRDAYLVFAMDQTVADSVLAGGRGEAAAPGTGAKKPTAAAKRAGSSSSRASGATRARTRNQASTRSSKTSAHKATAAG